MLSFFACRKFALAGAATTAFLITLAWMTMGFPREAGPAIPSGRFASVSFTAFGDGQSPLTGKFPTEEQADEAMKAIAPLAMAVRTYASSEGNWEAADVAQRHGLKLWQGIWLGSDRASNEIEVAKGIAAANAHPDTIERVVVGNEVLLRRDLSEIELTAYIDRVKAAVHQPVTYADVWSFWEEHPSLAKHVDIVTVHMLPYWEDAPMSIDAAVAHVRDVYFKIAANFPGMRIAIGEAGWPSAGRQREAAVPSLSNEAKFLREFVALAEAEKFDYNLIEAFDQQWKYQNEGVVGANWGILDALHTTKFPVSGPVSDNPRWKMHALISVITGLVLLLVGLSRPKLGQRQDTVMGILSMLFGGALGFSVMTARSELYDTWLLAAAAANLTMQAVLSILAILSLRDRRVTAIPVFLAARLRLPLGTSSLTALQTMFGWTALGQCILLVVDARYREFPIAAYAVPLLVCALPASASGAAWSTRVLGVCLAASSFCVAIIEGVHNVQALTWCAVALTLAAPNLFRLRPQHLVPTLPRVADVCAIATCLALAGVTVAFRHFLVEPQEWASACAMASKPLACFPRNAVIWMQVYQVWGLAALCLGGFAFIRASTSRTACASAVAAGFVALMNYNATWGVVGGILGAWAWLCPLKNSDEYLVIDESMLSKKESVR